MTYSDFVFFLWVITPSFILAFLIRSLQRPQKQKSHLQYLFPFLLGLVGVFTFDGYTDNHAESFLYALRLFSFLFFVSLPVSMTFYLKDKPDWLVPFVLFTLIYAILMTCPRID